MRVDIFLADNPAGPELFHLPCFGTIWNICKVVKINVLQCALGLVVDGQPVCENTSVFYCVLGPRARGALIWFRVQFGFCFSFVFVV